MSGSSHPSSAAISLLSYSEYTSALDDLADVLWDCVDGGAAVNFVHPFTLADAKHFFRGLEKEVANGELLVLVARSEGRIVGMVHLAPAWQPNQPHRADVKKLLVHRNKRGQGLATALMERIEVEARARGRTLLTLDTGEGSDAYRIYRRLGWNELGMIPNYGLWPDGTPHGAVFFWKNL